MTVPHLVSCLMLGAVLIAANGDRLRPPGRLVAGPAAQRSATLPGFERFYVTGWVSPPADSATPERIAELAGAGLNLMMHAMEDSGRVADNLRRLDLAAAHGVRCIVADRRFGRIDFEHPATLATIDSMVNDYHDHPAFLAYYRGDEPRSGAFPYLSRIFAEVRARDPDHPCWNNLSGRSGFHTRQEWLDHHRAYLEAVRPAVLSNDHYEFLDRGDRGQFVENAAGLAALAREAGIPFWSFIQLMPHGPFRRIGEGQLKWQIGILLAYGARGIGYFTYWTPRPDSAIGWKPAIIDFDGTRTEWYPVVARVNRLTRAAGETLAGLTWLTTVHAGSLPNGGTWFVPNQRVKAVQGRATLGYFGDSTGILHVLVANSDSLSSRDVTLTLGTGGRTCVLDEQHDTWETAACRAMDAGDPLRLRLAAGGFALVRLEGGGTSDVSGGTAPGLDAAPNPGRGEVRFALDRIGHGAHLEIVDAGGRRAWSSRLDPGQATLTWNGEKDGGGQAPPGIYFVRVEDERGVAVRRIVWLGR